MTLVLLILLTAWACLLLMVLSLCVSAARGDAALHALARRQRRAARFGRHAQTRMLPRRGVRH
jgi:hypothetical protein